MKPTPTVESAGAAVAAAVPELSAGFGSSLGVDLLQDVREIRSALPSVISSDLVKRRRPRMLMHGAYARDGVSDLFQPLFTWNRYDAADRYAFRRCDNPRGQRQTTPTDVRRFVFRYTH